MLPLFGGESKRVVRMLDLHKKLSDLEFIEKEIQKFKISPIRKNMIIAEAYYNGEHDILRRKRTIIGQNGEIEEIFNLPNNKLIDNQYAKLVDQKNNYLLSKTVTFNTDNKKYTQLLQNIFNKRFHRVLRNLGEDCLNCGIAWIYPYYNNGNLEFMTFKPYEILPFWKDAAHTQLDFVVRIYNVEVYEGDIEKIITKVEIYTDNGIKRYELDGNKLVKDYDYENTAYMTDGEGNDYSWNKIPIIPFKYNNKEIPLIKRVKALQDALNTVKSDFMNNMQEDVRNTILVLKNYDGTNLGEFRKNLATYGVVKVKSFDGADGGVETLKIEVNSENYKIMIDILKKSIVENARGYDAKDDRMSNNPNQMNIQSMYSDIDLDTNGMETEFQASFEQLFWFINSYLASENKGTFFNEKVEVIFNRDVLINETESINNCKASVGILSNRSIIAQHPWVSNVDDECEAVKKEQTKMLQDVNYKDDFNKP